MSGLLVATTIGAIGPVEPGEELGLPRALLRPRAEVPHRLAVRYAERVEKLEVLVLHVLPFARRNAMRGEQPVRVARAMAVEAELHRRSG